MGPNVSYKSTSSRKVPVSKKLSGSAFIENVGSLVLVYLTLFYFPAIHNISWASWHLITRFFDMLFMSGNFGLWVFPVYKRKEQSTRVLIILFSSHICFDLSIPLVLCMFLSTSDIIILCSFSVSNMFLHFPGLCFWELQYASRYFWNFPIPFQIYLFSVMKRGRRRCDTQGADCGFSIRAHL